jgi:hypothetical protein
MKITKATKDKVAKINAAEDRLEAIYRQMVAQYAAADGEVMTPSQIQAIPSRDLEVMRTQALAEDAPECLAMFGATAAQIKEILPLVVFLRREDWI